jgi:hypothetical protein
MRSVAAASLPYHKRQPRNFKGCHRADNGIVAAEDVEAPFVWARCPCTDIGFVAADTISASKPGEGNRYTSYGTLLFKSWLAVLEPCQWVSRSSAISAQLTSLREK